VLFLLGCFRLLLEVVDFRFRMLAFRGACGEPPRRFAPLARKPYRRGLPRRMPCEKYSQVAGTLIPQESRTLRSNQLVNEGYHKKNQKQQSFRKEPSFIKRSV
jgi:hypothetical protein